jgi:hypothetical protein
MDIARLVMSITEKASKATIEYTPEPGSLDKHAGQAILSFAAVGVLSFLPGPGYVSGGLGIYAAVKSYQAYRDHGKKPEV